MPPLLLWPTRIAGPCTLSSNCLSASALLLKPSARTGKKQAPGMLPASALLLKPSARTGKKQAPVRLPASSLLLEPSARTGISQEPGRQLTSAEWSATGQRPFPASSHAVFTLAMERVAYSSMLRAPKCSTVNHPSYPLLSSSATNSFSGTMPVPMGSDAESR